MSIYLKAIQKTVIFSHNSQTTHINTMWFASFDSNVLGGLMVHFLYFFCTFNGRLEKGLGDFTVLPFIKYHKIRGISDAEKPWLCIIWKPWNLVIITSATLCSNDCNTDWIYDWCLASIWEQCQWNVLSIIVIKLYYWKHCPTKKCVICFKSALILF